MSRTTGLAVVTGASTGIGAATARELAARGFHVLAGVRREEDALAVRAERVEPVRLDVTSEPEVAALAARVAADPAGLPLRALVNNAGIAVNAPVEVLPLPDWRAQFEVNFFGQVAVTRALLPALLASGGTVVNISSVGGRMALPTYGAYGGSKFALEGMSDALRREVGPLGVKVVVVQPGAVRTEISRRGTATAERLTADMDAEQRGRYGRMLKAVLGQAADFAVKGVSAERAAQVVAKAVTAARPRTRYTVGPDAAVLMRLTRVLPDRVLDRMARRTLRPYYAKADQSAS